MLLLLLPVRISFPRRLSSVCSPHAPSKQPQYLALPRTDSGQATTVQLHWPKPAVLAVSECSQMGWGEVLLFHTLDWAFWEGAGGRRGIVDDTCLYLVGRCLVHVPQLQA